jgi:molybdopterin-containing oxidoreductase family iron-sulfur binding subunit
VGDGEVRTACEQSCPADAIVFGNLADPNSRAARLARSSPSYRVLEELNRQPAVHYLTKVRHHDGQEGSSGD